LGGGVLGGGGGGVWGGGGGEDACGEDGGGSIAGLRTGRRVGFHLSALYSPWLTWSDIVCEWLRCKGDREALLNFVNSWLGEPWKDEKKSLRSERMAYWTEPYARGMIPLRAEVLTGGADVQQDYVWWRVSGRASTRESWLVDWGRTPSIEQLGAEGYADPLDRGLDLDLCWFADEVLDRLWMRYVDAQGAVCAASGAVDEEEVSLVRVCIDASHRTGSVYELCRRYHPLLVPVQGAGEEKARQVNRWQWFPAEKDAAVLTRRRKRGRRSELMYARLDTFSYKEELAFRFASSREDGTPGMFLPSDVSAEFIHQFCSEHKILARRGARGAVEERWVVRYAGIANHLWDCSVYDLAAADVHGIGKAKRMGEETRARRGGGEKKKFFANQKRKGG